MLMTCVRVSIWFKFEFHDPAGAFAEQPVTEELKAAWG
jgi:hypothetical protein